MMELEFTLLILKLSDFQIVHILKILFFVCVFIRNYETKTEVYARIIKKWVVYIFLGNTVKMYFQWFDGNEPIGDDCMKELADGDICFLIHPKYESGFALRHTMRQCVV
jgi:hypothetical protein